MRSIKPNTSAEGWLPVSHRVSPIVKALDSPSYYKDSSASLFEAEGAPPSRALLFGHTVRNMPPERAVEFYQRLKDLIREFDQAATGPDANDSHVYGLAIALYPMTTPTLTDEQP